MLDAMLHSDELTHVRGFLGPPTDYEFELLPPRVTLVSVITSIFGDGDAPAYCS